MTSWMTEPASAFATSAASATLAQVIARHGTADPESPVAPGEAIAPADPAAPAGSAASWDPAVSWDPAGPRDAAGDGSLPIAHPLAVTAQALWACVTPGTAVLATWCVSLLPNGHGPPSAEAEDAGEGAGG